MKNYCRIVLNDEPSIIKVEPSEKYNNLKVEKGNCLVTKISNVTDEYINSLKENFIEYNILSLFLSEKNSKDFLIDYDKMDNTKFYRKYLIYKNRILKHGNITVVQPYITKLIPFVKVVDTTNCYSLKDKRRAVKDNNFIYSYKTFTKYDYKNVDNNPATANLILYQDVKSAWNNLLLLIQRYFLNINNVYVIIYEEDKINNN